jgi:tetratricopeptide (TPR) repeat protein
MGLASSAYRQGNYAEAVKLYRSALPLTDADSVSGEDLKPAILSAIGDAASRAGDLSGGTGGMLTAVQLDTARFGPKSLQMARDYESLGVFHETRGDYARARIFYERAVAIRLQKQGLSHPLTSEDLNQLGSIAYFQRDSVAAERFMRQAMQSDMLVLGPDHPDVAITTNNLARLMLEQRKFADARSLLQRAVAVTIRNRSTTNDYLALLYANLGLADRGLGQTANARELLNKAMHVAELTKHRNLGPILTELADIACAEGQTGEGLRLLDRSAPITKADYPDDRWRTAWLNNVRGACLLKTGRATEGRALLASTMIPLRERWPAGTLYRVRSEEHLASAGILR